VEIIEEGGRQIYCGACGVLFCDGGDEEGGAVEVLKCDWECCWVGGVFEPAGWLERRGRRSEEERWSVYHIGDRTGVPSMVCWWKAV
jgi:hypothetical protein